MAKKHMSSSQRLRLRWLVITNLMLAAVFLGLLILLVVREQTSDSQNDSKTNQSQSQEQQQSTEPPSLSTEVVVDGRDHIWDLAFLPSGEILFTERKGVLSIVKDSTVSEVETIEDVLVRQGEGGLLGLTVDPKFDDNHYIYTCYNSTKDGLDVRVVRWRLSDDLDALEDRKDIITGMPSNSSGRHSGCRLGFGPDGYLWVGTGDSATNGAIPQDPKSLGGKILRVDRDGQAAALLNQSGEFDPRIFSYGHRNTQGLAFISEPIDGVFGLSTEHGPRVNDEINLLKGGNFGWNPVEPDGGSGYNESVSMTDTQKYPDAIPAVWSSGDPTQAPSGAAFVNGTKWKGWSGALAVSFLKNSRLKFFFFDDNWRLQDEQEKFVDEFGRLRAAVQGPDENLYVSTDNGDDDKIIRITPQ